MKIMKSTCRSCILLVNFTILNLRDSCVYQFLAHRMDNYTIGNKADVIYAILIKAMDEQKIILLNNSISDGTI